MIAELTIPGYRIESRLGGGGMAEVFAATDELLKRTVALKLMADRWADNNVFRQRFLKEAQIVAHLRHPNIVTVHQVGFHDEHYYIAMEYLSGGTLAERIKAGITPDQACHILCQIAAALSYAHKRHILHRDVKPANILFQDDETAVLSDFGISKLLDDQTQLTQTGQAIGTPSYMSPEQAMGKAIDGRSDLYSLGVVFYEMLTGHKPYQGDNTVAVVMLHATAPIPQLSAGLAVYQPILDRLMAKEPNERFASAEELIAAIKKLQQRATTTIKPLADDVTQALTEDIALTSALDNPKKRSRWLSGLLMTLLLAVIGTGSAFMVVPEWRCTWQPVPLAVTYLYRPNKQDAFQPLLDGATLQSGDYYKIRFNSLENSYIYIFQIDSSEQIYQLFPLTDFDSTRSLPSNPIQADTVHDIPSASQSFQLDDQAGMEHIYFLAFRERNAKLENAYQQIEQLRTEQNAATIEQQRQLRNLLEQGSCSAIELLSFKHL